MDFLRKNKLPRELSFAICLGYEILLLSCIYGPLPKGPNFWSFGALVIEIKISFIAKELLGFAKEA